MKIKFWGTRGSIPVTGKNYCKYGGNTSCIEISSSGDDIIILDAGSGIRELGLDLIKRDNQRKVNLFLSHFHTDHIVGLPFFSPFYDEDFEIDIYAQPYVLQTTEEILDLILKPPLFAITKEYFKAKYNFNNITNSFVLDLPGKRIEAIELNHPNPTLGFKISSQDKTMVYFTDNELIQNNHSVKEIEKLILENHYNLIEFCKNVDVLIHDASYSFDDYNRRIGWGHSSNLAVAIFANLANVKNLYLFHYEPEYDDDFLDKLLKETEYFLKSINSSVVCFASYDQLEINL